MPVTPSLGRLKQKEQEFMASLLQSEFRVSLDYALRLYLRKNNTKMTLPAVIQLGKGIKLV